MHRLRATDQDLSAAAAGKPQEARMLEEPAEDAPPPDPVRQPWYAGPERAHAPHDQVDIDTRLARGVQAVDDLLVDESVDLDRDLRWATGTSMLGLAFDEPEQHRAQRVRRDEQRAVVAWPDVA